MLKTERWYVHDGSFAGASALAASKSRISLTFWYQNKVVDAAAAVYAIVGVVGDCIVWELHVMRTWLLFTAAASGTELLPAPPLAYKKWSLSEQQHVTDHTPCGQ